MALRLRVVLPGALIVRISNGYYKHPSNLELTISQAYDKRSDKAL